MVILKCFERLQSFNSTPLVSGFDSWVELSPGLVTLGPIVGTLTQDGLSAEEVFFWGCVLSLNLVLNRLDVFSGHETVFLGGHILEPWGASELDDDLFGPEFEVFEEERRPFDRNSTAVEKVRWAPGAWPLLGSGDEAVLNRVGENILSVLSDRSRVLQPHLTRL